MLGEGERVEGFEEHGIDAQIREAALVGALHLGGEQQHGDAGRGGVLAQFAKDGGAIHPRHHHVQQDGVGLALDGARQALGAGAGRYDLPSSHGFEAECGYFPDVIFVVNDQDFALHD